MVPCSAAPTCPVPGEGLGRAGLEAVCPASAPWLLLLRGVSAGMWSPSGACCGPSSGPCQSLACLQAKPACPCCLDVNLSFMWMWWRPQSCTRAAQTCARGTVGLAAAHLLLASRPSCVSVPSSAAALSGSFAQGPSRQGPLPSGSQSATCASLLCPPGFSGSSPGPMCLSHQTTGARPLLSGTWHTRRMCRMNTE